MTDKTPATREHLNDRALYRRSEEMLFEAARLHCSGPRSGLRKRVRRYLKPYRRDRGFLTSLASSIGRLLVVAYLMVQLWAGEVNAQPSFSSSSPANATHATAVSGNISATFTEAIAGGTVSSTTFVVHGGFIGKHSTGGTASTHQDATYTGQGTTTLTMNPGENFTPGELVSVTLTTGLQNGSAQGLTAARVYQFRAAAGTGPRVFSNISSDVDTPANNTLSAAIGDVDGDGDLDLITGNNNTVNRVYLSNGNGTFAAGNDVATATKSTYGMSLGDLDGDGDLDILAGNSASQPHRVYIGTGSGTFDSGTDVAGSTFNARSVPLGDLDGDGDLDLVAVNNVQVNRVYLSNGNGTFAAGNDVDTPANATLSATLGDLDLDGDLDLVTGNSNQVNRVYLGNGNGTFASGNDVDTSTNDTRSVSLGDLDGDGDLDLVTGNQVQVNRVYLGNGNGTFASGNDVDTPTNNTRSVPLGDLDGDGDLDIMAGNSVNRVYLSNGNGTFASGYDANATGQATRVALLGDLDGDGDLDLVEANQLQVNRVYMNNGATFASSTPTANNKSVTTTSNVSATFNQSMNAATTATFLVHGSMTGKRGGTYSGTSSTTLTFDPTSDFKAGERVDVTLTTGLQSTASEALQPARTFQFIAAASTGPAVFTNASHDVDTPTNATFTGALGDLDNDGDLDFVAGSFSNQVNRVYLGSGNGAFASGNDVDASALQTLSVVLGDLDNDGDLDLVAGNSSAVNRINLNNGNGTFAAGNDVDAATYQTKGVALGDMDGDGDLDLVEGSFTQVNRIYLGNGNGTFAASSNIAAAANQTRSVTIGDVDNDGDIDFIAGNHTEINRVYLSNGDGTFGAGSNIDTPANITYSVALGDLDADGDLDLVTGNYSSQVNRVYLGNGNGTFATGNNVDTPTNTTTSVALGDVDGDGDLDLIAGNNGQANRMYLSNGNGTFASGSDVDVPTNNTYPVLFGDLDGDGDLDLVAGNYNQVNRVYLNSNTSVSSSAPAANALTGATTTNVDVTFNKAMNAATASTFIVHGGMTGKRAGSYSGGGSSTLTFDPTSDFKPNELVEVTLKPGLKATTGDALQPSHVHQFRAAAGVGPVVFTNSSSDVQTGTTNATWSTSLGDLDGDGDLDLITGNYNQVNRVYLGNGSGAFAAGSDVQTGTTNKTNSTSLGDLDGDGDLDLITGNYNQVNRVYLGNGSGAFAAGSDVQTGTTNGTRSTSLGDLDGDGDLDLITGNYNQVNRVYLGNGSGAFAAGSDVQTGTTNATYSTSLGDLDGDGDLDLITGNNAQVNRVYLGNGSGAFAAGSDVETGTTNNTRSISLGDLDGDGDLDLITGNNAQVNRVYLGNGSGAFAAGSDVETGTTNGTLSTSLGDLDGDGDLDLITGNNAQVNRVYLNSGNKDGTLTASATLDESSAIALPSTATTSATAVDLFDFTLTDGGGGDGLALIASQVVVNTSGTGPFSQVTWLLNGPDASNVSGTYSSTTNKITFSGLSISVADGANETYTLRGYYSTNTNLTDNATFSFSLDGDTDLTTSTLGSSMSISNSAVANATASQVGVTATQLAFTTQPVPLNLTSGTPLDFATDPVVTAQDASGNTDTDFSNTVTLAENGAGTSSFSNSVATPVSGVTSFNGLLLTYNATDGSSIALTASASGVTGATSSSLAVDASPQVARNQGARTSEGGTVGLSSDALSFTEAISTAAEVVYTLGSAPQAGQLVKSGNVLATGSTFTQDDIDQGRISYRHSGADTFTDSFIFSAKGKPGVPTNSIGFAFEIDPVNDPPALDVLREVQVDEGGSVVISNGYLRVLDGESHASKVNYTVHSGPFHGSLGRNTFSQADIDQSLVRYLHDGSETLRDSLLFNVADGNGSELISTWLRFAVRALNDGPIIPSIESPHIKEGELLVLDLAATDPEGAALTTTVTGLPTGATLDGTMLKWLPLYDQAGSYPLAAVYDDGHGGTSRLRIDIHVSDAPVPMLLPEPSLVDFGDVPAGETADRSFALVNQAPVALDLAPFSSTSSNLNIASPVFPQTLEPGERLEIIVRFTATADRADLQQALLTSATKLGPAEVPVVGRSVWRRLVTDNDEIAFLPAVIGDTRWKHLNLSNPGNLPLDVVAHLPDDTPFGVEPMDLTLLGGEKRTMRVRFVPVMEASAEALLALVSEEGQLEILLRGQGREREEGRVTIDFNLAQGNQQQSLAGDAIPGSVYVLQLHAKGAPQISGWSVRIDYERYCQMLWMKVVCPWRDGAAEESVSGRPWLISMRLF